MNTTQPNPDSAALSARLQLAVQAARQAGQITLEHYQSTSLQVDRKSDDSPVTIADRRAELFLREQISAAFADDAILGEEFPDHQGTSGYRWILDPIDGTKSFIHGVPLYGTLIGVEHAGQSQIGVIHIPVLDESVYAACGQGAWYSAHGAPPQAARVSSCTRLAEGLFLTSEVRSFDQIGRRAAYDRLQAEARLTRTWGDCYGYLMIATGRADVMVDPLMNVWDAAALLPILQEAGGVFTDWNGQRTIYSGNGIGTNHALLDAVLAITKG